MRISLPVCALAIVSLSYACAQGSQSGDWLFAADGGGSGGDGGDSGGNPYADPPDTGTPPDRDSGAQPLKDSTAPPPVDSGNPPVSGANDCTGSTSAQLSSTYDDACDAYYFNTFGKSNPCTPGGNDCASMTGSYTFCCYTPQPGSYCDDDYFGEPQCLPQ